MRLKRLPPAETATLATAIAEVGRLAQWAARLGFVDIAVRMEWVATVLTRHDARDGKLR